MAEIIGQVSTSHVPAIGAAIAKRLQQDPYWKPLFDGFPPVREWLGRQRPDVALLVYNDHGLNFFLDKMPTFAVGAAPSYVSADEGWGIPTIEPVPGDQDASWAIIEGAVADEFDVTTCQEMLIDHAVTVPLQLLWPDQPAPVRIVPIAINTVQHPVPSPARCLKFGQSIGRAIARWRSDAKVVIVSTGGLSHQLDGERAGFINKDFDLQFMDSMIGNPAWATRYSTTELVELSGTQGVELLNWMVARGTLPERVRKQHANYHIPISNTASGLMVLEPQG